MTAPVPPDANGLREDEYELLCTDERDADEHTVLAVERIVAARESAAATRARAEGAAEAGERIAQAIDAEPLLSQAGYERRRALRIARSDAAPHTRGQP